MSKLLSSLLLSSLALADASASPACVHADSFTSISFDNATLVTSNLGGEGGRCSTAGLCSQLESASTPPDIYFAGVGAATILRQRYPGRVPTIWASNDFNQPSNNNRDRTECIMVGLSQLRRSPHRHNNAW